MDNTSTGPTTSAHDRPWLNTSLSPNERAALLLAQMTLEEKISMVHGVSNDTYSTAPISRLGIPALPMTTGQTLNAAIERIMVIAPHRKSRMKRAGSPTRYGGGRGN